MSDHKTDIVVVGGGPTAMAAALECASFAKQVILLAPEGSHVQSDARTTALMIPSINMLKDYGVWEHCEAHSAALKTLRLIDDTNRLVRAPTTDFQASEIDEEAFGYNIPNQVLNAALQKAVDANLNIKRLPQMVSGVGTSKEKAHVMLEDGTSIEAALVVGADGVQSIVRQSAGIDVRQWKYPQTACVAAFDHARSHNFVSSEFHTPYGPFTQVPLLGKRSSLVWVMRPEDVEARMALEPDELALEIERRLQSILGKVSNVTKLQAWPLSSSVAHTFGAKRIALIGQAAHAFPPIGAQGLNLGFRDIADLGAAISKAGDDVGSEKVTKTYDRKRRADVYLRTGAVDALNRSLLGGFLPLQIGRAVGMSALKNIGPLRTLFMREGFKPGSSLSTLLGR